MREALPTPIGGVFFNSRLSENYKRNDVVSKWNEMRVRAYAWICVVILIVYVKRF